MLIFLILAVLILFILYDLTFRWRHKRIMKLSNTLPGPRCVPLVGNAHEIRTGPVGFIKAFTNWEATYGRLYRVWACYQMYVFASRPEDVDAILNNGIEKDYYLKFVDYYIGEGILISPAAKWKFFRKIIQPSFNTKILNQYCHTMAEHSQTLNMKFEQYANGDYFDCFKCFFGCTLDVLFETNLGYQMNFQKRDFSKYIDYSCKILTVLVLWMGKVWLHIGFTFQFSTIRQKLDFYKEFILAVSRRIIKEKTLEFRKKRHYQKENSSPKPFLEQLISAKESGQQISDHNVECEVNTLIVAGSDTTANVMCYVLMCLGVLQDIQGKVHEELDSIFGSSDRECTVDDIKSMTYLEMVIKETMRIFTPVPILARYLTQDVKLDTVTLAPGTYCVIGVLQMHRSPKIYPDPLKFDPNRFSPEETARRHPSAFIPFGGGPRNCVGQKFAYMSMKIILSTVLRRYRVYSDVDLAKIDLKMEIFLKPVNGYRIRLEARNQCSQ